MPFSAPTAAPIALPPTVSAAVVASLLTNSSNSSLPPIQTNFSASEFTLFAAVSNVHSLNEYRAVQTLTVAGPELGTYVTGLVIVPIIMIIGIVVWFVLLCVVDGFSDVSTCTGRKRISAPCRCKCCPETSHESRDVSFVCFTACIVAAWISWLCGIVFCFIVFNENEQTISGMLTLNSTFIRERNNLLDLSSSLDSLATTMLYLAANCSTPSYKVNSAYSSQVSAISAEIAASPALAAMLIVASNMTTYASDLNTIFTARVTVLSIMMLIMLFLLPLVLMGVFIEHVFLVKKGIFGRCETFEVCVSRVLFIVVGVLLVIMCWVVAAFAHVILLANSDLCFPNGDINLVNVLGQFSQFQPAINYPISSANASTIGICDLVYTHGANQALQFLCYYQTCQAPASQSINVLTQNLYNMTDHLIESAQILLALNQSSSSFPTAHGNPSAACPSELKLAYELTTASFVQTLWALYLLSCSFVHPIYDSFYNQMLCGAAVEDGKSLFGAFTAGCCFTMVALIFYIAGGLAKNTSNEPFSFRCCPSSDRQKSAEEPARVPAAAQMRQTQPEQLKDVTVI